MVLFSSQFCGLVIRVGFSCSQCDLLAVCDLNWAVGLALQEFFPCQPAGRVSRQQQVGLQPSSGRCTA